MTLYQAEDKPRIHRQRAKAAIALAMAGRWEDAAELNRSILEIFPEDVDAYNRLGKALMELGRFQEARDAFNKALQISPHNSIARKNVERLSLLSKNVPSSKESSSKVSPRLFLGETGKSGVTSLVEVAPPEVLAKVVAGDLVDLRIDGKRVIVASTDGTRLGQIEPKLALRLIKLVEGGNRYATAITSAGSNEVSVIIKEVYQHPSQRGRPSFPTKGADDFRPYLKNSLLRYGETEEESPHDNASSWEEEPPPEEAPFYKDNSSAEDDSGEPEEEES